MSSPNAQQRQLAEMIAESRLTVALTGAGISTPSGVPDFRSPRGVWSNVDPMEAASIGAFRRDKQRFWDFYRARLTVPEGTQPNAAHFALARLEQAGLLAGVITQNIDGLHQAAGSQTVYEVHGTGRTARCSGCGHRVPREQLAALEEDGVPRCPRVRGRARCRGALRPDVVLFGENLPAEASRQSVGLAVKADLMICVGSSLVVHPVAGWPELTLRAGGRVVVVNGGWTPYHQKAALVLSGDVAEELPAVVEALGL